MGEIKNLVSNAIPDVVPDDITKSLLGGIRMVFKKIEATFWTTIGNTINTIEETFDNVMNTVEGTCDAQNAQK